MVFETEFGLIDAKGMGSQNPKQESHGNGLSTLGEAIREFTYEKLVKSIFCFSDSSFDTVGSYAVLAFDFKVKHNNGSFSPAGAILRQAHDRYKHLKDKFYNFLPGKKAKEIELLLRTYGITSAGTANENLYMADLQGTKNQALVDFGTFLVMNSFDSNKDLVFFACKNDNNCQDKTQPNENICVSSKIWGCFHPAQESKFDNIRLNGELLARKLWDNKITRFEIEHRIYDYFLGSVYEKWFSRNMICNSEEGVDNYLKIIFKNIIFYKSYKINNYLSYDYYFKNFIEEYFKDKKIEEIEEQDRVIIIEEKEEEHNSINNKEVIIEEID